MSQDASGPSLREATDAAGSFSPGRRQAAYLAFGAPLGWRRLALRLAVLVAVLALADAWVARSVVPSPSAFSTDYRLPRTLPTAALLDLAGSIEGESRSKTGGPIAIFLGASPTWGERIEDPSATYPAAFRAAAAADARPMRVYNLACNGQFVADYLAISRRLSPAADVVFVQLTYHTFNPDARDGRSARYPELPRLLGGGDWLAQHWLLWRERDSIAACVFGGRPQPAVRSAILALLRPPEDDATGGADPAEAGLDDVDPLDADPAGSDPADPAAHMIAISRYAENATFRVSADDSEVRALVSLTERLSAEGKKAVFFMAPLNPELVNDYQLIDPETYRANVAVLRGIVESSGFPFLDFNDGTRFVPAAEFADVSHTTDAGGRRVGKLLYDETERYLDGRRP